MHVLHGDRKGSPLLYTQDGHQAYIVVVTLAVIMQTAAAKEGEKERGEANKAQMLLRTRF